MRAMPLEFPDDPGCDTLDRQYMLGPGLLVAPVFSPDGQVDYYLPQAGGRWTNFITGETCEGGRWLREKHGYLSLPLMVRPNTILPVGAVDTRPDYDYANGVTFQLFEIADGADLTASVPAPDGSEGLSVRMQRDGDRLTVRQVSGSGSWSVLLRGLTQVQSGEDADIHADQNGIQLTPVGEGKSLSVLL